MAAIDTRQISSIVIESHYKLEVFAHIDGPLWIKPLHTAVVIPILELGASTVTLTSRAGVKYDVVWQLGSIHCLGGMFLLTLPEMVG
jgi:hypothetical protein